MKGLKLACFLTAKEKKSVKLLLNRRSCRGTDELRNAANIRKVSNNGERPIVKNMEITDSVHREGIMLYPV